MRTDLFDFPLPPERIALRPARPRDAARLLVVRPGAPFEDRVVRDLPELLRAGDQLVVNDTRVIPASLHGRRVGRGPETPIEANLVKRLDGSRWNAFVKPAKRLAVGDTVRFGDEGKVCFLGQLDASVEAKGEGGEVTFGFSFHGPVLDQAIAERGNMPLPPYIASRRAPDDDDRADYQTLFAHDEGSVAAPTAGLHFTDELVSQLKARGIGLHTVTLHVGAGTFLPVKTDTIEEHRMHAEYGVVSEAVASALNEARRAGGRVVAVGSTSLRLIESAADELRRDPSLRERDIHLHHTGLRVPRRGRDADQLPSAALDAVHADRGILRPRHDEGRLRARHRSGLPLLLLRRRLPSFARLSLNRIQAAEITQRQFACCKRVGTPGGMGRNKVEGELR